MKIEELKASIDSIEAAIAHLEQARDNGQLSLALGSPVIADLQMMRVARMVQLRAAERRAEKELGRTFDSLALWTIDQRDAHGG